MKTTKLANAEVPATPMRPLPLALALAFFSMTASAGVTIDQQPLNTQKPIPPNIWFILDDSGSMNRTYMPDTASSSGINGTVYTRNTLSYNPAIEYIPWYNADGTRMSNANPTSVSSNVDRLTGSTDLTASQQCFHVPKSPSVDHTVNSNLWRWRFNNATTASRCASNSTCSNNTGCTAVTSFTWSKPDGTTITRSVAQEWQNYANWYHYYRTRMKMAKAATTRAFAGLDEQFRVGYTSIWDRSRFDIPVGTDGGLFRDANRTTWYTRLLAATSSGYTPLREALDRAGQYFSSSSASGPYGPESGSAQLSCRQNFTILTTDGYWNDAAAGTAAARADNDSTNGAVITGIGGITYQYIADHPFKDGRSNTLADVAMHYWKNDLRDLKNDVPKTPNNPAFWQHMRTFGISIGLQGTLNPKEDLKALTAGTTSWPAPSPDSINNIDDLWHAAVNSRGEFLVATNPEELASALADTLTKISSEARSATGGGASASQLSEGTMAFFTEYASGAWSGEIKAYELDPATAGFKEGSGWSASANLPAWDSRNIYFNDGSTQKPFTYANLNATQQTAMGSSDHVDYLRGDRSKEKSLTNPDGIFRERASVLADFVNSQLVHVGTPNANIYKSATFTGASSYKAFTGTSRRAQVYVGGNGGMLHAIDAKTGVEKYAFVPSSVITADLKSLTDPDYVHRYFVDGELTVASTYVGGGWKSILVGSLGRGGKGLFALDVTDPDAIKFLWEKTASEIPALGNSLGKPVIAQVANGDWRVLVGNGPNGSGDLAQLIMLDVATGAATTVSTGEAGNNGLSAIRAWDSNGDGFTDSAYAGDLNGNLWRFTGLGGSPSASLLFSAGATQPIMAAPVTAINPETKDLWVFVGTGRYLNEADAKSIAVQSWYGLIDAGTSLSRGDLVERKFTNTGEIDGRAVRVLETGSAADLVGKSGWHIDFDTWAGERMILPNTFYGNLLVGATLTPEVVDLCNPTGRGMLWGINPFTGARMSRPIFDVNGDGMFTETLAGDPVSGLAIEPIFAGNLTVVGAGDGSGGGSGSGSGSGGGGCGFGTVLSSTGGNTICDPATGAGLTSWREILGN